MRTCIYIYKKRTLRNEVSSVTGIPDASPNVPESEAVPISNSADIGKGEEEEDDTEAASSGGEEISMFEEATEAEMPKPSKQIAFHRTG